MFIYRKVLGPASNHVTVSIFRLFWGKHYRGLNNIWSLTLALNYISLLLELLYRDEVIILLAFQLGILETVVQSIYGFALLSVWHLPVFFVNWKFIHISSEIN